MPFNTTSTTTSSSSSLLLLLLLLSALASSLLPIASGSPLSVSVGLYVTTIGDVDVSKGTFAATFYAHFSVPKAATYFDGRNRYPRDEDMVKDNVLAERILQNAASFPTSSRVRKIDSNVNTTNQVRMKGKFYYSSDSSEFPFDTQTLVIAIEDPAIDTRELVFVPETRLSSMNNNIRVPGWRSEQANSTTRWDMHVREKQYPGSQLNFSRIEFEIYLSRHPINAFMKTLLPPFFILVVQVFSFTITPENTPTRISIAGSGMIAAVMFHANLQGLTPPTGSLLFSDKFMLCTYAIIVYNGIISIVMLKLYRQAEKPLLATLVYHWAEFAGWSAVPVVFLLLVLSWYHVDAWLSLLSVVLVVAFLLIVRACIVRAACCAKCCKGGALLRPTGGRGGRGGRDGRGGHGGGGSSPRRGINMTRLGPRPSMDGGDGGEEEGGRLLRGDPGAERTVSQEGYDQAGSAEL